MDTVRALFGVAVTLGICIALSSNRRAINYRLVLSGIAVQALLGLLVFGTAVGSTALEGLAALFAKLLAFSYEGTGFVFGDLGRADSQSGFILGLQALPIAIYFAALAAILYHVGIMQVVIYGFSRLLSRLLPVSGAESMVMAANVFVGMTEAPLVVRPYLNTMTRSELNALMTGGFATIAGTVFALYVSYVGAEYGPFLIAASVMSAPAAFVTAKVLVPETESPATGKTFRLTIERRDPNVLSAITTGVTDGLKLALNIGAMLIAFYALVALINWPLEEVFGVTLQSVFGYLLRPLAWCLGVEWSDADSVGTLLGMKLTTNELVAYSELQKMIAGGVVTPRSTKIASIALCGFANIGSIGVVLGGLSQLMPERREELSRLAFRAMLAGALASFQTAAIAGAFLSD